jgi:hypothetical protein
MNRWQRLGQLGRGRCLLPASLPRAERGHRTHLYQSCMVAEVAELYIPGRGRPLPVAEMGLDLGLGQPF